MSREDDFKLQSNMPFNTLTENCGEWVDSFNNQLRNRGMSLEEQWDIISKKYDICLFWLFDIDHDEDGEEYERELCVPMIKLPNIRLKCRRWIPLGDYYITLNFMNWAEGRESQSPLQFWNHCDIDNTFVNALHPHISGNGTPCMGNFGPLFTASYQAANLIMITALVQKFLRSHYARSVFHHYTSYVTDQVATVAPINEEISYNDNENSTYFPFYYTGIEVYKTNRQYHWKNKTWTSKILGYAKVLMEKEEFTFEQAIVHFHTAVTGSNTSDIMTEFEQDDQRIIREITASDRTEHTQYLHVDTFTVNGGSNGGWAYITMPLDTHNILINRQVKRMRDRSNEEEFLLEMPYVSQLTEDEYCCFVNNHEIPFANEVNEQNIDLVKHAILRWRLNQQTCGKLAIRKLNIELKKIKEIAYGIEPNSTQEAGEQSELFSFEI